MKLVAVDKDQVVGFIFIKTYKKSAYVGKLFVSVNHMREGIGTRLYFKSEKILKKNGIKKIRLHTNISPNTLDFYKRMKFKNLGRKRININGIKVTLFELEKNL